MNFWGESNENQSLIAALLGDPPARPAPLPMPVAWARPAFGWWFLQRDAGNAPATTGVYIIWKTGASPYVVRVGSGIIRDRLMSHARDPMILRHDHPFDSLHVTWAPIGAALMERVERFLGDTYGGVETIRLPDVKPFAVTLPS